MSNNLIHYLHFHYKCKLKLYKYQGGLQIFIRKDGKKIKAFWQGASCLNPFSFLCWTFTSFQIKILSRKTSHGKEINCFLCIELLGIYCKLKPSLHFQFTLCWWLSIQNTKKESEREQCKRTRIKEMYFISSWQQEKKDSPLYHYHAEKQQVIFWNNNQFPSIDWKILQRSDQQRATEAFTPGDNRSQTHSPSFYNREPYNRNNHTIIFLLIFLLILEINILYHIWFSYLYSYNIIIILCHLKIVHNTSGCGYI